MKVVQALHWLRDTLPQNKTRIVRRLHAVLRDPKHGKRIRDDLRTGLPTLPIWMQELVRELLVAPVDNPPAVPNDRPALDQP